MGAPRLFVPVLAAGLLFCTQAMAQSEAEGLPLDSLPTTPTAIPPFLKKEFVVPDAGPGRTPYACSFHWFRLPDDRIAGMDVVRSNDKGKLALRFFLVEADGSLRALIRERPIDEWEPFATGAPLDVEAHQNALGRSRNRVAGVVHDPDPGSTLSSVAFDLSVEPNSLPWHMGDLGIGFVKLVATDIWHVPHRGRVGIDGVWYQVDSIGMTSIHTGSELPEYGYLVTVPDDDPKTPDMILAATGADNIASEGLRRLIEMREGSTAYAHFLGIPNDFPHVKSLNLEGVKPGKVRFRSQGKTVKVGPWKSAFPHTLLDVPTTTFVAEATLRVPKGLWPPFYAWFTKTTYRVLVIGDMRGQHFIERLAIPPEPEADQVEPGPLEGQEEGALGVLRGTVTDPGE